MGFNQGAGSDDYSETGGCRMPRSAGQTRLTSVPCVSRCFPKMQTIADGPRMNVTLKPFDFAQAVARAGLGTNGQPLQRGAAVQGAGFQQALTQALGAVAKSQNEATALQREVALDNPTVSLEQTMVAMQKAQIGFQGTLQVRNKLVQAYSDIMQMQV